MFVPPLRCPSCGNVDTFLLKARALVRLQRLPGDVLVPLSIDLDKIPMENPEIECLNCHYTGLLLSYLPSSTR